ncbi:MAG: alpha-N-arabinofuranosidase, partial [Treponema sp.]|nr:alpha-N-arabinofuranosidase [Treponema sp.]
MNIRIDSTRVIGKRDSMIYGHFIEHFHRQIYGGIFDPDNPLSDEDGFRTDVIDALKKIKMPVIRWPGGCFVSAWHWKDAIGPERVPSFDKAWRVEEPNTFGTDEFIAFCRKTGSAPYICTNAGSGSNEEMSDWVEYCNLKTEGKWAKQRIKNGNIEPFNVKYWSIGNENYLGGEIGAKSAEEWGRLVCESSKMMKRVDPSIELSAAALADLDWNINLLRNAGERLSWISLHQY